MKQEKTWLPTNEVGLWTDDFFPIASHTTKTSDAARMLRLGKSVVALQDVHVDHSVKKMIRATDWKSHEMA